MIITPDSPASMRTWGDKWRIEWALGIAHALSEAADCTRRRVGAVIFDNHWMILGQGYNGAPRGEDGCATRLACPRGRMSSDEVAHLSPYTGAGRCIALHAEVNALMSARFNRNEVFGARIFITDEPCSDCRAALTAAHIGDVYWPKGHLSIGSYDHEA